MRRLLGSPYVLAFAVLVLLGVLVWAVLDNAERRVRTVPGPVVVAPPRTPLPDRVLDEKATREPRTARRRAGGQAQRRTGSGQGTQTRGSGAPSGRSRTQSPTRETPRTTPKPRPTRPAPSQPPQTSNPPSPPPERPTVDITAPLPTTACIERVGGLNCP